MNYLSTCSGIEAATVAWHPLGWLPVAFSEIEHFPCDVLKHHYPNIPNLGDMTKFKDWPDYAIDILVGGTPCQSFSVAGLRKGLDDPRGNLTLVFLALVARFRPRWVVWENVPGVLSDQTGAFGSLLGGLGQLGYGFAYRILDAQFFGVPQRRRRVFIVGHIGGFWQRAAAVLFERESLSGNPPPRREERERVALPIGTRVDRGGSHREAEGNNLIAPTLSARNKGGGGLGTDFDCDGGLIGTLAASGAGTQRPAGQHNELDFCIPTSHSLRADGFDASEDGTGRGTPLVPEIADCLQERDSKGSDSNTKSGHLLPVSGNVKTAFAVRRLTPRECERLQGFPDDYTLIPRGKKMAADGPRYKALGNSMAVPVMRWIGERIQLVESLTCSPSTK